MYLGQEAAALIEGLPAEVVMAGPIQPMTPISCAKPSPPEGRSPSSLTTRHERSNIRSTSISTPERHLVESSFPKLKQFRRVATRIEKTARNYRSRNSRHHDLMDAISVHTP